MTILSLDLIEELLCDAGNDWSIGSLGAIGEFRRAPDEPVAIRRSQDAIVAVTHRGALRVNDGNRTGIAWETLSADGETWQHALALCVPIEARDDRAIRPLGRDRFAIRPADRDAWLFDLGVGAGCIRMCIRTGDPYTAAIVMAARGTHLLQQPSVIAAILETQPHRVLLSPVARLEVFGPIPAPHQRSPDGPHTHLMPRLVAVNRPHSANDPFPRGCQSGLTIHPGDAWRSRAGRGSEYDAAADRTFQALRDRFGVSTEVSAVRKVVASVQAGEDPGNGAWPDFRRGRIAARVALRRLVATGDMRAHPWRRVHDAVRSGPLRCGSIDRG